MQSSRHEKAGLVAIAYGIGALTAFIWFSSANQDSAQIAYEVYSNPVQTASVINAVPPPTATPVVSTEAAPAVEPVTTQTSANVTYKDGLLEYQGIDGVRVLSFNADVSGFPVGSNLEEQGFHLGELFYTVSPSGEYVFFCENKSADSKICRPYVYDALTDTIYAVRQNDKLVDLLNSATASVNWNGSVLNVGTESSLDQTKPWLL